MRWGRRFRLPSHRQAVKGRSGTCPTCAASLRLRLFRPCPDRPTIVYLFTGAGAGVADVAAGAGLVAFLTCFLACFLVVFLAVLVLGAVWLAGAGLVVWAAKPIGRLSAAEIIAIASVLIFILLFSRAGFLFSPPSLD